MRNIVRRIDSRLMLTCALLLPLCAHADTQLYVDDVAPFWYREGGDDKGLTYELLQELSARVGNNARIKPVPLKREMELVETGANALGTIIREPERESSYRWISKLLEDRVVLITRADSPVDISSMAAARKLRIGVMLGGPSEIAANRLGFTHIEAIPSARANAYKLALGRIDAWIVVLGVALYTQVEEGKALPPMRVGAELETIDLYLASSRAFDPERARKWKAAFDSMRKDGSYARILSKYHYPLPK